MSLRHAILGFLSLEPLTGYDLKKHFDESVQHFWPANQSQIYRTLVALYEDGLVELEVVEREGPLDKKVYHLTAEGKKTLHRWLSTPLPPQDTREAFLIQIYFGGLMTDAEVETLLQDAISEIKTKLSRYEAIHEAYRGQIEKRTDSRTLFMRLLTLEYGILTNEASLAWLKSASDRLAEENYSLREPGAISQ
jgi:DNA-binding PadR family transcriptional regulator